MPYLSWNEKNFFEMVATNCASFLILKSRARKFPEILNVPNFDVTVNFVPSPISFTLRLKERKRREWKRYTERGVFKRLFLVDDRYFYTIVQRISMKNFEQSIGVSFTKLKNNPILRAIFWRIQADHQEHALLKVPFNILNAKLEISTRFYIISHISFDDFFYLSSSSFIFL